jgi:hypothetical protein
VQPGNDLFVHTLSKQFCVLHPNGCLANDPESLSHTVDAHKRSDTHQLIFYSMLLETTKPYLVNCVRVPVGAARRLNLGFQILNIHTFRLCTLCFYWHAKWTFLLTTRMSFATITLNSVWA